MSDSFIYCELKDNEFKCDMSIFFMRKKYIAKAKIDTGAYCILIPLKTLGIKEEKLLEYKDFFVSNNFICGTLRGVEGTFNLSKEDYLKMSKEDKLAYRGFRFIADYSHLFIDNYYLGNGNCSVTCDTSGNILLGMSVLKDFDIHIGVSRVTGKCTFIGCLNDKINKEYLDALLAHFGYVSQSFVEQACESIREQAYSEGIVTGYTAKSWNQLVHKNKILRKPLKLK